MGTGGTFPGDKADHSLPTSAEVKKMWLYTFQIMGGVESNWVHSALRPPVGLLCQPRVIMMMGHLVEWWLTGETEVLGENLPQCHFVHHKCHIMCPSANRAAEVESQRLTPWAIARPEDLYIRSPITYINTYFCSSLVWYTSLFVSIFVWLFEIWILLPPIRSFCITSISRSTFYNS
jgi:hypothetical protein